MKSKILPIILASICLSGCNRNDDFCFVEYDTYDEEYAAEYGEKYFLYNSINFYCKENPESIIGIDNTKTTVFTNEEDYLSFENSLKNVNSQNEEDFAYFPDVDFSKQKVAVTFSVEESIDTLFEYNAFFDTGYFNTIIQELSLVVADYCEGVNYSCNLLFVYFDKNQNFSFVTNYEKHDYMVRKPIIYFYPEQEMDLTVKVTNDYNLITTYPKYNNGWNIHLNEDGTFTTNNSDREYYALYFDEKPNYTCHFDEGFYVTKDNAISFLEEKMDYIGFTNRETNEFIMYWLPILEDNEKSLVYFEQTEQRNAECPLEFSTNPDTLIRTIIHIKKVDVETQINEQTLTHYDRNGFVVTEWGGINY